MSTHGGIPAGDEHPGMSIRARRWRAWPRLLAFALLNVVLVPVYALAGDRLRVRLRRLYCRLVNRLIGLRVEAHGAPCGGPAVLYVANHVSYLDVPVLGSLIDATFVAKAEIAHWPLFGLIGRLTRTVFIERSGGEVLTQRRHLAQRLAGGDSLILFPEGTSTDGAAVRPFKSSLFSIAGDADDGSAATVQPISIAYVRARDRTPLTGPNRALYGWFGGATLLPHLARVCGLPGAVVEVRFHPPLRAGDWRDRKDLARRAHALVAAGVAAAQRDLTAPAPAAGDAARAPLASER